ncbi:Fc.00g093340.m01.CDS01 [Cosmosporella sp. VM-42]
MTNRALVFKRIPEGYLEPGKDLAVAYDPNVETLSDGVIIQSLYASFDPYMRDRMRPPSVKSYAPRFKLNKAAPSASIAKVLHSNNACYEEGDLVIGRLPIQEYTALHGNDISNIRKLENPLGIEDIRVFLGPLGMPGLAAYSSPYEIGKPKKGETIFVSAASGASEKLEYPTKDLDFDGGFTYKDEKPKDALPRLAPEGLDIYYENVSSEHLEAALDSMKNFRCIIVCGLISEYNSSSPNAINMRNILVKRLTMRGFIVGDPGMGEKYTKEHQERVRRWIEDGSLKVLTDETVGIGNAATGLVGIFYGENKGRAVLKFKLIISRNILH